MPTIPLIAEMQLRAAEIARAEVDKTLRRLSVDPEIQTYLDAMAQSIVDKVLDPPSARLRKAAEEGAGADAIVQAARQIFQLASEPTKTRSTVA